MKKATKPAAKKEIKTKPKAGTALKPKIAQKIKSAVTTTEKKTAKAKDVLPAAAKPKAKAGIKQKTKIEAKARPGKKIKTETKPPLKSKAVVKKKEVPRAAPKKATAAPKSKAKTKVEKKPLKVAAPKKAAKKVVLKSPLKRPLIKAVSPAKKPLEIQKKKAAPAKTNVPAAAKNKTVAAAPKKAIKKTTEAPKKVTLQAAGPSIKPKAAPVKATIKRMRKTTMITAGSAKLPLKNKLPVQTTALLTKAEPVAKTLSGGKPGLRSAVGPKARKPEEKIVKKVRKTPSKPAPVAAEKSSAKKDARPVAKAPSRVRTADIDREPALKKQIQEAATQALPVKKAPIVRPAVPVAAVEDELLSVGEIEAREGRVVKPRLKIFLPREEIREESFEEKEGTPGIGREALPAEYGESEFFMIVIDPILIFLDWEIVPGNRLPADLSLCVRIYDVTGITFDGTNAHGYIDIDLEGLTGSGYCEIGMQGREIIAEIGFIDAQGVFIALMRSVTSFVPPLLQYDELGIVRKMQEAGLPVGY